MTDVQRPTPERSLDCSPADARAFGEEALGIWTGLLDRLHGDLRVARHRRVSHALWQIRVRRGLFLRRQQGAPLPPLPRRRATSHRPFRLTGCERTATTYRKTVSDGRDSS